MKRIKSFNPNMKIIVCLRNPIDQTYSHYNHLKQAGVELDSFENALSKEEYKKELHLKRLEKNIYNNQKLPVEVPYLYVAQYVTHIKKALDVFNYENFFFIDSNDLKHDTQNVVNSIFEFLGVENKEINIELHNVREYVEKMPAEIREKLSKYFLPYNDELEQILKRKFDWD
jgi:hypothetical protein